LRYDTHADTTPTHTPTQQIVVSPQPQRCKTQNAGHFFLFPFFSFINKEKREKRKKEIKFYLSEEE